MPDSDAAAASLTAETASVADSADSPPRAAQRYWSPRRSRAPTGLSSVASTVVGDSVTVDRLRRALAAERAQVETLRGAVQLRDQQQREAATRLAGLAEHNARLVARIEQLQNEVSAAAANHRGSRAGEPAAPQTVPAAMQTLQELAQRIATNERLESELAHIRANVQHENDRLQANAAALASSLAATEQARATLEVERDTFAARLEEVEVENQTLRAGQQAAADELAKAVTHAQSLASRCAKLENANSESAASLVAERERLAAAQSAAETSVQAAAEAQRALEDAQAALLAAETRARDAVEAQQAGADQQAMAEAARDELEAQCGALRGRAERAERDAAAAQTRVDALTREIDAFLRTQHDAVSGSSFGVSAESLSPYLSKIGALQRELEESRSLTARYHRLLHSGASG